MCIRRPESIEKAQFTQSVTDDNTDDHNGKRHNQEKRDPDDSNDEQPKPKTNSASRSLKLELHKLTKPIKHNARSFANPFPEELWETASFSQRPSYL